MDKKQTSRKTKQIIISGIVQGVGFRPLVYHIACKNRINGTVRNTGGMVEIIAISEEKKIDDFILELKNNQYGNHEIQNIEINEITFDDSNTKDFRIIDSNDDGNVSIIPPDLSVCPECSKELFEKTNIRYENPFISCMVCGPRYTILEELPYDRINTTMKDFDMCDSCAEEYINISDRRFHAQTISCNDCGPYLIYKDNISGKTYKDNNINEAVKVLKSGGIIAVKGIGGYHLVCSPFIEETVIDLRKLKGREEKPFAVMFEDVDSIKKYCFVTNEEEKLLESKERPIVLVYAKSSDMAHSTGKGSMYCGAFLPYTPLQILLLKECGPLIMTSANISNKPIIKDDEEMLSLQSKELSGILYNTRRIVRSVDDSVAKIIDGKMQIIRRSRGYVPYPIFLPKKENKIFAAGGDLKSAFCLYYQGNAVISQYFGDLEEAAVLKEYEKSYLDLSRLLKVDPDLVVCDMHPNYFASKYVKSIGKEVLLVQHHHAHIASVMAENNLTDRVIGVAFDGTGYGTDGNIWGGEFLICEADQFERVAHLNYTTILGGDSSMKDARKTATCLMINSNLNKYINDDRKTIIEAAIDNQINTVETSSMGRLFDAVSSILGLCDENTYEGECAVSLEKSAMLAKRKNIEPYNLKFDAYEKDGIIIIDYKGILEEILIAREAADISSIALGFHIAVANMILEVSGKIRTHRGINKVALSGGVFQNTLLMEETIRILRNQKFEVYINRQVPPNDGGISLGQTYIGLMR